MTGGGQWEESSGRDLGSQAGRVTQAGHISISVWHVPKNLAAVARISSPSSPGGDAEGHSFVNVGGHQGNLWEILFRKPLLLSVHDIRMS